MPEFYGFCYYYQILTCFFFFQIHHKTPKIDSTLHFSIVAQRRSIFSKLHLFLDLKNIQDKRERFRKIQKSEKKRIKNNEQIRNPSQSQAISSLAVGPLPTSSSLSLVTVTNIKTPIVMVSPNRCHICFDTLLSSILLSSALLKPGLMLACLPYICHLSDLSLAFPNLIGGPILSSETNLNLLMLVRLQLPSPSFVDQQQPSSTRCSLSLPNLQS